MLPQCVILAGGRGMRMRPHTDTMPKAMIPVLGRPFVDWQLRLVADRGIKRLSFCIGYGGEALREFVGDGSRYGMTVRWVCEEDRLLGTGGALRLALDRGGLDDVFFVLYGDSYLPIKMRDVAHVWEASGMPALMTVLRNDGQWDHSNAIYSNGRVILYDKSQPSLRQNEMCWIDYGLSVLTRDVVAECIPPDTVLDLAEVLKDLSLGGRLAGFEVTERFYEVGSPQGLRDLEAYLRQCDYGVRSSH